uniref:RRM domain-containing protein n=1 Tax=Aureoumbra lagunensis TaxID=44058 RepID=A0A7S3NLZ6_9STRA|mmetsp:Transcript_20548/g.31392  ORF Transcript_20548/g.31392 Transcript_20548/m.31392 type:complete len:624 (+) Transcript_20548:83-1954(+)
MAEEEESEAFLAIPTCSLVEEGKYAYAVRLRSIPWSVTASDVCEFLGLKEDDDERIILVHNASGDGYARALSLEEAVRFQALDGMKLGGGEEKNSLPKIEIYQSSGMEADKMASLCAKRPNGDYRGVVRLKKLPSKAQTSASIIVSDIFEKKEGSTPKYNITENDITLVYLNDDQSAARIMHNGAEAYAIFISEKLAQEAANNVNNDLGIDAFVTTRGELYSAEHWAKMRAENRSIDLADINDDPGILRVRGLPFEANRQMIVDFFQNISIDNVFFPNVRPSDSKPSGECFVAFDQGISFAAKMCIEKNGQEISGRWLEIYESNQKELVNRCKAALRAIAHRDAHDVGVLRLRGLPFQATLSDVSRLVEAASEATRYAFQIREPAKYSIFISGDGARRPIGEAFVLLQGGAEEAQTAAAAINGASLGDRVVLALPSAKAELFTSLGDDTLHSKCILIRSLPFNYCDFYQDPHHQKFIDDFLTPDLQHKLESIFFCRAPNSSWRATGDAYAKFYDDDAVILALALNRSELSGRFLELYPCSQSEFDSNHTRTQEQISAIAAGAISDGGPPLSHGGGARGGGRGGRGHGGGGRGGGRAGRGGRSYGGGGPPGFSGAAHPTPYGRY